MKNTNTTAFVVALAISSLALAQNTASLVGMDQRIVYRHKAVPGGVTTLSLG